MRAFRSAARDCGTTRRKANGNASSISCMHIPPRRSACNSVMRDAKARRSSDGRRRIFRCRTAMKTGRCGRRQQLPYFEGISAPPAELDRAEMDRIKAEFVDGNASRGSRRLRHAGIALRARLSVREFPLAADQPADGRIWRVDRESTALSPGSFRSDARGVARGQTHVHPHFRQRLGTGRHHRGRCARHRARVRGCGLRPREHVVRPDCADSRSLSMAACIRCSSPKASAMSPG